MVGFSRHPGSGVDAKVSLELSEDCLPTLKEYQEQRKLLRYTCTYEGIDGTVFGVTAETAGRPPTDSILDLSQGEMGLAMTIIILFGLGFIAGRSWERLLLRGRDALPR